jgi:hypothetical protein
MTFPFICIPCISYRYSSNVSLKSLILILFSPKEFYSRYYTAPDSQVLIHFSMCDCTMLCISRITRVIFNFNLFIILGIYWARTGRREAFRGFPLFLHVNVEVVPQIRPRPLLSTSLPFLHSLIIYHWMMCRLRY